jgi:NADPH-dependent ferric siderophore reductase
VAETMLTAETRVALADPASVLALLARHLAGHATVSVAGSTTIVENTLGRAELQVDGRVLCVRAIGRNAAALSVVKMSLAEHLVEHAAGEPLEIAWTGHDAGRRDIPYFRTMTVRAARQLTPHMRRVTLGGPLAGLDECGLHVRILIPPSGRPPVWPHAAADGRIVWPTGEDALTARVYTIRQIDRAHSEIAIDVVIHPGEAPGSAFALSARPGDAVGVMGPGGGMLEPAGSYLFLGDETALPAIARMLEELPATARAVARIEVADDREEQPIRCAASLDLRWLHRDGRPAGTTTLLQDAVRALDWPDDPDGSFAWAACEQGQARVLRQQLSERGLDKRSRCIAAYWRLGQHGIEHDR